VVGIGGGAFAGTKNAQGKTKTVDEQLRDRAAEASKLALQKLLQGSVLSSSGWYIDRDRTIRIMGGPNATMTNGFLVIETDTTVPFRLVDETGRTVAVGNQDGGDPVPLLVSSLFDKTEEAARLSNALTTGVGSALLSAAAPSAAPILKAQAQQQKKDGFWKRVLKGEDGF
jgi:hypothetical protein